MTRDGDWSGGAPQADYPQSDHQQPHAGQPGSGGDASRIEALLHSVIDRLEENESRYNTALNSLESRLKKLSSRAAGTADSPGSEADHDAFARLGTQAAELAQQVRSAGQSQRAQQNNDRFRMVEDRISEFAARVQQGGMAPAHAEHQYTRPSDAPAPATPDSFGEQFTNAAAGFEQSLAAGQPTAELEAINARIDDLVQRFDTMASQRNDAPGLHAIEVQLDNLAAQFDQAREHYARVDAIESNLVRLMELARQSDTRIEAVAVKVAQETARHMGAGTDDISDRLDTVQRELRALTSLTGRLAAGDIPASAASQPQPIMDTGGSGHAAPTDHAAPEPPAQPTPIPVQNPDVPYDLDVERSQVGASIPDYQQTPHPAPEPAPAAQSPFGDDSDFLASARRAAAAAASQAPQRGRKRSLFSGFRRGASPDAPSPAKTAKPRSLFVTATFFLVVASAALIYGRMQDNPGVPASEAPAKNQPAEKDKASVKSHSSSLAPALPHIAEGKDESKLPAGSLPLRRQEQKRAPLATEQLPAPPASQQTKGRDGGAAAAKLASIPSQIHVDPGIPGIAVRISDTDEPAPPRTPAAAQAPAAMPFQQVSIPQADARRTPQTATPAPTARRPASPMPPAAIGPQSLRVAAAHGDAAAQFEIATRYAKGSGVKRDYKKASEWFARAASQSLAPAQYRLAALYERGRGVTQDPAMAKVWYERAAKAGNVKAMHNLAAIYSGGGEHRPDNAMAAKWFTEAARYGLADSQFNLGILYESGLGVKKNPLDAYQWFALAAAQGDKEAEKRKQRAALQLRPDQLRVANQAIRQWRPKPRERAANEVHPPEGGWRAVASSTVSGAGGGASETALVLQTQSLLNKLGYDAGVPDGLAGPQTESAIRRFQTRNGLSADGKITSGLLARLDALSS